LLTVRKALKNSSTGLPDVLFSSQNSNFGSILAGLYMEIVYILCGTWVCFMAIWYISWSFGIFWVCLVYFHPFWVNTALICTYIGGQELIMPEFTTFQVYIPLSSLVECISLENSVVKTNVCCSRGQCYNYDFLRFLPIFSKKVPFSLKF
jgi:hypothetical protein